MMRRAKIQTEIASDSESKVRSEQPDRPCHKPRDSLFSSPSDHLSFRGSLNLCIIIMVLATIHVIVRSIIEHGVLIDPLMWLRVIVGVPFDSVFLPIMCSINFAVCLSLLIEKSLAKGLLNESVGIALIVMLVTALLCIPAALVYTTDYRFVGSFFSLVFVSINFLKLVSYHMVNYWCRHSLSSSHKFERRATAEGSKAHKCEASESSNTCGIVVYPENLTFKDIYYFFFAPTVCYQLNFPRSAEIRKGFLAKRIIEMCAILLFLLGVTQQWIAPTFYKGLKLEQLDFISKVEWHLSLMVPFHFGWLMCTYWLFHSFLNANAEVMQFADRHFYGDWWNADSYKHLWQRWNIPIHKWCARHVYKPLLENGFSKAQALTAVFVVSAFFHEYLACVPFKLFRIRMFVGMLGQVPLLLYVDKYLYCWFGNLAIWLCYLLGNASVMFIFYAEYYFPYYHQVEY